VGGISLDFCHFSFKTLSLDTLSVHNLYLGYFWSFGALSFDTLSVDTMSFQYFVSFGALSK